MQAVTHVLEQLKNRKMLILGLGREGWSTYRFLRQYLPDVKLTVADKKQLLELPEDVQQTIKQDPQLDSILGPNYLDALAEFDLVFKTPGISVNLPKIQQARQNHDIEFSSNTQLFLNIIYQLKRQLQQPMELDLPPLAGKKSQLLNPIVIGITGTKGKSTTTALTHHLLKSNQMEACLLGNIGRPPLTELQQVLTSDQNISKTKFVIEMSSHQLSTLTSSPDVAVVQQVTSEHLDYFASTVEYVAAKTSITEYQKVNQYVIYNPHWPATQKIAQLSPGIKVAHDINIDKKDGSEGKKLKQTQVSSTNTAERVDGTTTDIQVYIKSNKLIFRYINSGPSSETRSQSASSPSANSTAATTTKEVGIIDIGQIPLIGAHNLYNLTPAVIVGLLLGLSSDQIASSIQTFQPLPHRLEFVAEKNQVKYYNDSMATMPEASISALSSFGKQPIILIAGGHERNQDFGPLAAKILENAVTHLILFPPNGQRLLRVIKDTATQRNLPTSHLPIAFEVENMQRAVELAHQHAQPGSIVLLSPAAASFGVFENYADRGNQFKEAVLKIK